VIPGRIGWLALVVPFVSGVLGFVWLAMWLRVTIR